MLWIAAIRFSLPHPATLMPYSGSWATTACSHRTALSGMLCAQHIPVFPLTPPGPIPWRLASFLLCSSSAVWGGQAETCPAPPSTAAHRIQEWQPWLQSCAQLRGVGKQPWPSEGIWAGLAWAASRSSSWWVWCRQTFQKNDLPRLC